MILEDIALWLEEGIPARMVWRGERWRVSDTPTPLCETVYLTHPMVRRAGWRFQGTNGQGDCHVFDVQAYGDRWRLIGVYQ